MSKSFEVPNGIRVGQWFPNRMALTEAWVHRPPQNGISGNGREGADSVVVSGGYIDDEDHGEYIIYTGMGGNDRGTRRQIADQVPEASGNAGLIVSHEKGWPVRVIRGPHKGSLYAPATGYVFSGLYRVANHWSELGRDGFKILRFRLEAIPGEYDLGLASGAGRGIRDAERLEARVTPPSVSYVGDLFRVEPVQYSLRGDDRLWRELRTSLAEFPMPEDPFAVRDVVAAGFEANVGIPLTTDHRPIYVPRFDPGHGMSAGHVDPRWWADTAIPILMDRFQMIGR